MAIPVKRAQEMDRRVMRHLSALLVCGFLLLVLLPAHAQGANIVKFGRDVTIEEGTTVHNVLAIKGQVTVKGTVERHVVALGGSVVLGKTAVVGGKVVAVGGVIVVGSGAQVEGSMTEIDGSDVAGMLETAMDEDWEGWSWLFAVVSLMIFLCIVVLACLIVIFLPKPVNNISTAILANPFRVTVWGIAGLVLIMPLAVLLAVSVVGLVLVPLEFTLAAVAILIGFIAVAQLVGRKALTLVNKRSRRIILETMLGLVILWAIGWIPYVGWLVKVCAAVLGLGGVLITRFGLHEDPLRPLAPSFPSPGNEQGSPSDTGAGPTAADGLQGGESAGGGPGNKPGELL